MTSSLTSSASSLTSSLSSSSSSLTSSGPIVAATIIAQFRSESGEATGPQVNLPTDLTPERLEQVINDLLQNDEKLPYSFYISDVEVVTSILKTIQDNNISTEQVLDIVYQPQAIFKVRSVTRCTSALSGHTEAVLSVNFSPDGQRLASGSGDATVRIWDINTETPEFTCTGHCRWVLCVSWAPDAKKLASGSMDNDLRVWSASTSKHLMTLKGHQKYITCLAWEPMHLNPECSRLASGSKDGTIRIWNLKLGKCEKSLSGHTMSVTCVKWGGEGLLYSASQDRTIKVYAVEEGKLVRTLQAHAHWVNYLSLHTDFVLRTGAYDHTGKTFNDLKEAQKAAEERYVALKGKTERLVSCSDDHTICLWQPAINKNPVARMPGHQQPVNMVCFSPDGRFIASASFDKSVKLWDGNTGKFLTTLRGHVGAVYQVSWSSDSRLLVSGSKDSTLKVWDMSTRKLKFDLPGHADEVFSVDWSPDGQRVASGSKDRLVKIWRH